MVGITAREEKEGKVRREEKEEKFDPVSKKWKGEKGTERRRRG